MYFKVYAQEDLVYEVYVRKIVKEISHSIAMNIEELKIYHGRSVGLSLNYI